MDSTYINLKACGNLGFPFESKGNRLLRKIQKKTGDRLQFNYLSRAPCPNNTLIRRSGIMNPQSLGDILRMERFKRNFTQEEVCKVLKMKVSTLSRIENNKSVQRNNNRKAY